MIGDVMEMERHAFNIFRRAAQSVRRYRRHGARRRDRGAGQFLDSSEADRLPENLPEDHRRSSLRDGATGRRRATGSRHCHSARTTDEPRSHRHKARQASHLCFRFGRIPQALWRPSLAEIRNHRLVIQHAPQVDDSAYARVLGLKSLEGIVGIQDQLQHRRSVRDRTGSRNGLPADLAGGLGRNWSPVDLGVHHHADLWLAYHKEFRNSDRHKIVIDWLKKIFDPKTYPCFRDEFITPTTSFR